MQPRIDPSLDHRLPVIDRTPWECPYIPDRMAVLPLRVPNHPLSHQDVDTLLASGHRRSGLFWYHTDCHGCQACEATRIPVQSFRWTRSLKRVLKRSEELDFHWTTPFATDQLLELFNRHRRERGLHHDEEDDSSMERLQSFLVDTSCDTRQMVVVDAAHRPVAVAVMDVGQRGVSAVYTYFCPDAAKRYSLGTLAVLKEIEFAMSENHEFLYLGFYVESNRHLNYKARFVPQQRMIGGQWHDISDAG